MQQYFKYLQKIMLEIKIIKKLVTIVITQVNIEMQYIVSVI